MAVAVEAYAGHAADQYPLRYRHRGRIRRFVSLEESGKVRFSDSGCEIRYFRGRNDRGERVLLWSDAGNWYLQEESEADPSPAT